MQASVLLHSGPASWMASYWSLLEWTGRDTWTADSPGERGAFFSLLPCELAGMVSRVYDLLVPLRGVHLEECLHLSVRDFMIIETRTGRAANTDYQDGEDTM